MNNKTDLNEIHFLDKHIGGDNKDTIQDFNNQSNIITNEKTDYNRMIDYFNKIERTKNENNEYIERLDNERHATIYRINNFPTYVDDVNYSNPLIYPKDYDPYFDYLNKKNINPLNTQVVKKKEYLNIDSANRISTSSLNIDKYLTIKDYGLEFKNDSNILKIHLKTSIENELSSFDKFIILRGFKTYVNYYDNLNFFFTNGSPIVVIDIKPNFSTTISYANITIIIEGLEISNPSGYWKNIPIQLLNGLQKIYIEKYNSEFKLSFKLPINFYSTNQNDNIFKSSCKITFNCLGNYPINLINANTPLTSTNLTNYLTISSIKTNYIEVLLTNKISLNNNIDLDGYWVNDSFFTGKNIQIGNIVGFIQAYSSANNFSIFLNKTYNNVAEIKIISSAIPNVQKNIMSETSTNTTTIMYANNSTNLSYVNNINNRLYWENILDYGIYQIELETGNYSYPLLKQIIENKVSKVKRKPIIKNNYLIEYNYMEVEFIESISESKFTMYDIYNVPNCLIEFTDASTSSNNIFKIKIYLPNHNLIIGDKIYITESLDYFVVDKKYINSTEGHIISNVWDDNYFEIIILNINTINDVGDTKGGYGIKIKKKAIFKLYFNFKNTIGKLIGFKLVGYDDSITNYSNAFEDNIITNKQKYYNDISNILIVNNVIPPENLITDFESESYSYLLLLIDGLNNNNNPNGPSYFYKFLINQPPNNYLFNTFVNSPVYFNPPISNLNSLSLTLVYPNGGLVNMGNLNYSLTFEITTVNNIPENTNINTNMSRI
jgi:hypothetical protein